MDFCRKLCATTWGKDAHDVAIIKLSHVLLDCHGVAKEGHDVATVLSQSYDLLGFSLYLSLSNPFIGFISNL